MARRSDYGRLKFTLSMDRDGILRSPLEAKMFREAKKRKKIEKAARKKNRRK